MWGSVWAWLTPHPQVEQDPEWVLPAPVSSVPSGLLSLRRLILSLSLAIPQFRLLSHVSSLRLPSGYSGLVLTLSNAACSSPFSPYLLVLDVSIWGTFLLGVAFRHVKACGFYLFFLPVRLSSEIRKLPPDPPVRGFPGVWKLPVLRLPSRDGSPSLTLLSLFYILSYLLSKTMGCFSGHLMSSASDQKLFCGVLSVFK